MPLHPRLVAFQKYFRDRGIEVDFINASDYKKNIPSRINWLALWFFDLYAINRCKAKLSDYDIIFINDLKYLPLAKHAYRKKKTVIYDTIDHNVYLRLHQLEKKLPIVKLFRKPIIKRFTTLEKLYGDKYCDEIIVNSDSLREYFGHNTTPLYYSSPFEALDVYNNPQNPPALLYLGGFTLDKGGDEILDLHDKFRLPLFIFGPVKEKLLERRISQSDNIMYSQKLSIDHLAIELKNLLTKYFLFGFSMIKPAHYSYEVQEANKDIDYLSLGIPLIGNYRLPTRQKIEAGCGIFYDDKNLHRKVVTIDGRKELSENCKQIYHKKYSSAEFTQKLDKILAKYLS
jgi:hypothetical protein